MCAKRKLVVQSWLKREVSTHIQKVFMNIIASKHERKARAQ